MLKFLKEEKLKYCMDIAPRDYESCLSDSNIRNYNSLE